MAVSIHAKIENQWVRALEIPREDIERLSLKPLKRLRFVCFATFGAKGNLHTSEDHSITVEYEAILQVNDLAECYYFPPEGNGHIETGDCQLIDRSGLNDRRTSSATTPGCAAFRQNLAERDGNHCVVTRSPDFEAAHIIPHSKGDKYMRFIIGSRSSLYDNQHPGLGIDSTENGMLLSEEPHTRFGQGRSVFLKTPNYALNVADIERVGHDGEDMPVSRTTFQHLEPYPDDILPCPLPQYDVQPDWSIEEAPPRILLDFAYGIADMQRWATNEVDGLLDSCEKEFDKQLEKKQSSRPSARQRKNGDNSKVKPHHPSNTRCQFRNGGPVRTDHRIKDSQLSRDRGFEFAMLFGGYEPGTTLDVICQQYEDEAETHSQKNCEEKVRKWLGTNDTD